MRIKLAPVNNPIRNASLSILAGIYVLSGSTNALAFDPVECARIVDVEVPYEVDVGDGELQFAGSSKIIVTPSSISIEDAVFANAALASQLYDALEAFLHSAAAMADVAARFGFEMSNIGTLIENGEIETSDEFLEAVTTMCMTILALEGAQSTVEASFGGFQRPVEITLK